MKIAILSDIHDNIWNLKVALASIQKADALVFCGDLCSPFVGNLIVSWFPERPIHMVFGNNDGDQFRITKNASTFDHVHLHGELFQGELDGKLFAANHFDQIALPLAQSGRYDIVCFGHNHRYQIERFGKTLAINPGTLMGYDPINKKEIAATFVIYDTQDDSVTSCQVEPPAGQTAESRKIIPYPY